MGEDTSSPSIFLPENLGRKIQIQRSGHLNLYLLLDASQSVKEEDFRIFKESAILMVDRVRGQAPCGAFLAQTPSQPTFFKEASPFHEESWFNL